MSESLAKLADLTKQLTVAPISDEYGVVLTVREKLSQAGTLIKDAQDSLLEATTASAAKDEAATVVSLAKDVAATAAEAVNQAKDEIIVQLRQDLKSAVEEIKQIKENK